MFDILFNMGQYIILGVVALLVIIGMLVAPAKDKVIVLVLGAFIILFIWFYDGIISFIEGIL